MTRDLQGFRDGLLDPAIEDEIYAALWATVPFPRLPEDAPDELNDFIVDIKDPKRLYIIHRAVRRYQFQILVDRLVGNHTTKILCTASNVFQVHFPNQVRLYSEDMSHNHLFLLPKACRCRGTRSKIQRDKCPNTSNIHGKSR
jgi:hypothetical protein